LNTEAHPLRIHSDYRFGSKFGSMPDGDELEADDYGYDEAVLQRVRQRAELIAAKYPRKAA